MGLVRYLRKAASWPRNTASTPRATCRAAPASSPRRPGAARGRSTTTATSAAWCAASTPTASCAASRSTPIRAASARRPSSPTRPAVGAALRRQAGARAGGGRRAAVRLHGSGAVAGRAVRRQGRPALAPGLRGRQAGAQRATSTTTASPQSIDETRRQPAHRAALFVRRRQALRAGVAAGRARQR